MGQRLALIGRRFAADGIRFAYHNHDWDFLTYGDRAGLAWLFDAAAPQDLGWEVDVGWLVRSGQDAAAWIAREGGRLAAAHVKELAREGEAGDEDGWTTLGRGVVPWDELTPMLRAHTDLFVLEHDNPKDLEAFLRDSLGFMRRHFA
jgi:sugar phosphate isomerase/epimerase